MATADTSIRVSRGTLAEIVRFQRAIGAKSADDALQSLIRMKRNEILAAVYGIARGRLRRFREEDRLDSDR